MNAELQAERTKSENTANSRDQEIKGLLGQICDLKGLRIILKASFILCR